LFVNSTIDSQWLRTARSISVERLDLTPTFDFSLDDDVEVTAVISKSVALLRTKDGNGEYVARRGEPVLDSNGNPLPEMGVGD